MIGRQCKPGDRAFESDWSITGPEDTFVQLRHVRLTVRDAMGLIAIVGILLAWGIQGNRLERQKLRLRNQDIATNRAEAHYRNSVLRREEALSAIARHIAQHGDDDTNPALRALKDAAKNARFAEQDLEQIWFKERTTLSRLIGEFANSW